MIDREHIIATYIILLTGKEPEWWPEDSRELWDILLADLEQYYHLANPKWGAVEWEFSNPFYNTMWNGSQC